MASETGSFRAKPGLTHPLFEAERSPYKEQFKDFWSTPVPFADREFGAKPKLGDPVPTRRAVGAIVVARNRHVDPAAVEAGADNDYKVLMMYREGKGRYMRDQFVVPAMPLSLEDSSEDWAKILRHRGVTTQWLDLHHRLAAHRVLFAFTNLLVIPKEGGCVAEVEGPPGPKRWHLMIHQTPKAMKTMINVLQLPMESVLAQFLPFRHIETPTTETFRYDTLNYLVPIDKVPDVNFTISTEGERLVWVSPMEAMARFNAGIMNMPTANVIAMSELNNECPTFADVMKKTNKDIARTVQPELYRHDQTRVATVVLPGDIAHSATTPEDRQAKYVRRLNYTKDFPYGVRAVLDERPASPDELAEELVAQAPALLEEANEMDQVYASVPYPKRERSVLPGAASSPMARAQRMMEAHQREDSVENGAGAVAYKVPQFVFQEGPENDEGLIPPRLEFMQMHDKPDDMFAQVPKDS